MPSFVAVLVALAAGSLSAATQKLAPDIRGDVDGDRSIDMQDLLALRQALDGLLALPPDALARADVDGDGAISESDYHLLQFPALDGDAGSPFQDAADPLPVIDSVAPSFGPAGTVVTITGSGFGSDTAANAVAMGAVDAPIVAASNEEITVVVPPGAGRVMVTNLETGLSSARRSFVLAETETPEWSATGQVGEVVLGLPARIPLPNSLFTVPVAANVGSSDLAAIGVRLRYDPAHVQAVDVVSTAPDYLTPMPPCIDNASGLLGAGALRTGFAYASLAASIDPHPLFQVVFRCVSYRAELPQITARVEAFADGGFPGQTIGAPTPRYATRAIAAFPPPEEWAFAELLGSEWTEPPPVILSISGGPGATFIEVSGAAPLNSTVVLYNTTMAMPKAVSKQAVVALVPDPDQSAYVMLLDPSRGVLSNEAVRVAQESIAPSLEAAAPPPGATGAAAAGEIQIVFDEAVRTETLASGWSLEIGTPGGPAAVAAAASAAGFLNSLVLRPAVPLPAGATVTVRLHGSILDLAGNPLAPTQFSFCVAAR